MEKPFDSPLEGREIEIEGAYGVSGDHQWTEHFGGGKEGYDDAVEWIKGAIEKEHGEWQSGAVTEVKLRWDEEEEEWVVDATYGDYSA